MIRPLPRPLRLAAGLLLLPLCFVSLPAWSKDSVPAKPASDAQILDFMADWQGDDGQWTDPMTFARIDPAKVKAEDAKRHGRPALPPPAGSSEAPAAGTGMDHAAR
ncbi:MAG TPA: hypothetical protein VGH71_01790 [Gammaproteobacteria bacterium]